MNNNNNGHTIAKTQDGGLNQTSCPLVLAIGKKKATLLTAKNGITKYMRLSIYNNIIL